MKKKSIIINKYDDWQIYSPSSERNCKCPVCTNPRRTSCGKLPNADG